MSTHKKAKVMSDPTANYTSPSLSKSFNTADHPDTHHTTNGRTTGPSQFVIDAGAVDKDQPSQANDTYLGKLRAKVTTLQDDLNEFLTERMANAANGSTEQITKPGKEEDWEKKLLDGGDSDSDEGEEQSKN